MGVLRKADQILDSEQSEALTILTQRASMALVDRQRQQQVFSTLEEMTPQIDMIQRLRAAARYDGSEVLSTNTLDLNGPGLTQWVKDALTHYWGGPKLTENPLMDLSIVQNEIKENDMQTVSLATNLGFCLSPRVQIAFGPSVVWNHAGDPDGLIDRIGPLREHLLQGPVVDAQVREDQRPAGARVLHRQDVVALLLGHGHGLLDEHMLAAGHGAQGQRRVGVVPGGDEHRVHVRVGEQALGVIGHVVAAELLEAERERLARGFVQREDERRIHRPSVRVQRARNGNVQPEHEPSEVCPQQRHRDQRLRLFSQDAPQDFPRCPTTTREGRGQNVGIQDDSGWTHGMK